MQSLLSESNYWFLGNLNYVDALLSLEITEGIVSSSNKNVKIEDLGTIEDCNTIEITDQSRRVQIKFSNVLAYQVTDESYWASEYQDGITKNILCVHNNSKYLQYIMKNSIIKECVDNPVKHYSLTLADDIIDIIATSDPSLEFI
ncbi:MAG: hypothetical protein VX413_02745 [Verrucomicrobiota bacterium]|nr:hypothetical protein [Verrucomicrobiota bacterium]